MTRRSSFGAGSLSYRLFGLVKEKGFVAPEAVLKKGLHECSLRVIVLETGGMNRLILTAICSPISDQLRIRLLKDIETEIEGINKIYVDGDPLYYIFEYNKGRIDGRQAVNSIFEIWSMKLEEAAKKPMLNPVPDFEKTIRSRFDID